MGTKAKILGVGGLVVALGLCGGLGVAALTDKNDDAVMVLPEDEGSAVQKVVGGPSKGVTTKKASATDIPEGVWSIGEDFPAGTYRVAENLDAGSLCYWSKSSDPEGDKIIDNDIPTGGRPQVVLKKGQWFKTQGCGVWKAR